MVKQPAALVSNARPASPRQAGPDRRPGSSWRTNPLYWIPLLYMYRHALDIELIR